MLGFIELYVGMKSSEVPRCLISYILTTPLFSTVSETSTPFYSLDGTISRGNHLDIVFKLLYGLGQRIFRHVYVGVHGGLDAGMAQQLLQDFRLHTALNGPGGIGVTEGVHGEGRNASGFAQLV